MIKYEKANCCGSLLDKEGVCECETFFVEDSKCPECGCNTYCYNDPGLDISMSSMCTNSECDFLDTQFLSWEEIKKIIVEKEIKKEVFNNIWT